MMSEQALKERREYYKQWHESNKEKRKEYMKEWRKNNKDKIKQYQANYWNKKASENDWWHFTIWTNLFICS